MDWYCLAQAPDRYHKADSKAAVGNFAPVIQYFLAFGDV